MQPNVLLRLLTRVVAAALLAGLLMGCGARKPATPAAPSSPLAAYRIVDQDVRVHFIGGEVRIQASYQLQNTGEVAIEELRVSMRQVNSSAAYDMRLSVDGSEIGWERYETADDRGLRAALSGAWWPGGSRIVILTYAFRSGMAGTAGGGYVSETFQLFPGAWSPILLAPQSAGGGRVPPPAQWSLSVTVPAGMLVHAGGQPHGSAAQGDQIEHRFSQSGDKQTFVLAGRYREDVISSEGFHVHFWSSYRTAGDEGAERPRIAEVSRRVAAGLKALTAELGPREVSPKAVWVVFGGGMRYIMSAPGVTISGIAPDVILDTGLLADPTNETLCNSDELLASLWVSWYPRPEPKAAILAEQLAKHVAQTYPGGCGFARYGVQDRAQAVRFVLEQHAQRERAAAAAERAAVRDGIRFEVQALAMRLFVFAIEDAVGREKLTAAIRRLLHSGRDSWSAETFRDALEAESRKKLAPLFAKWLEQPVIPADFVAQYSASAKSIAREPK